ARSDVEFALVDGGKTIPDVTILRAQRCVAVHRITELSLPADLARHQNGVAEPVELAAVCLEAVLHGEELLTNLLLHRRIRLGERLQEVALAAQQLHDEGVAVLL